MLRARLALSKVAEELRDPFQLPLHVGAHGVPGERYPGGAAPLAPLPLSPPYREAKATNLCRFANLKVGFGGFPRQVIAAPVAQPWCSHPPWAPISHALSPSRLEHCSSLPAPRAAVKSRSIFPSSFFFPDSYVDSRAVLLSRSHYMV